ncbi:hypothetical protein [Prosthecomicrobium sp. N25]|uniref:hypothetical protein n=1 Tax=Prosthecomicrobium sp. N25 TaxID=3129254 RepID=UPI003076E4D7
MKADLRFTLDLARAGAANAAAGVHAAVTITQRLPAFSAVAMAPFAGAAAAAEVELAMTEKVAAIWLGAIEAGLEWQRFGFALASGAVRPEAVPSRWLAVAEAAAGPARRTVRANAKRLTRPDR